MTSEVATASDEPVVRCSKCGAFAKCYCRDVGGVNYEDEYTLHCENCGHTERESIPGGSPTQQNWPTKCPFCHRPNNEHPKTPKKLW